MSMTSSSSIIAATLAAPDMSRETSPSTRRKPLLGRHCTGITSNGYLKVCVSGRIFELNIDRIMKHPDSLLANPDLLAPFYQPDLEMFFFDRNRSVFEYITQFYQADGYMEFPEELPRELLEIELTFFKIGFSSPCEEEPEELPYTFMDKGRAFFNEPYSSIWAKLWMCLDIFFIITSVVIFIVRTETVMVELEAEHRVLKTSFLIITILCAIFFTLDLGGRFVFCESKWRFFLGIMPWLDIIAIIPLYIEIFEDYITVDGDMLNILKLFRMARVARCLKIIRRSKRLVLIFRILIECKEELSILLLVWATGTVMSGSIMYFVEEAQNRHKFYSVLESCWWAIITIGTIGYGNILPISVLGKMLTTIIIFCSMIFMTVPMTFIIRRFSDSYEKFEGSRSQVRVFGTALKRSTSTSSFSSATSDKSAPNFVPGNAAPKFSKLNNIHGNDKEQDLSHNTAKILVPNRRG